MTDNAGVLSGAARSQLEAKLAAFEQARGAQIALIVLPARSPNRFPITPIAVGGVWKIGRPKLATRVDGGCRQDRRAWISVARSLEGANPTLSPRELRVNKWGAVCEGRLRRR